METGIMKFSSSDLKLMQWNIAAIFASALLSSVILYASGQYTQHSQKDFMGANNQMRDARNQLNNARLDHEYLAAYAGEYADLESRKIIGDEHRLDWMEGLDQLRHQNLVVDFSYTITPQKIYAPQPALDSGNFDINYSEMQLQFELVHEQQLLNFFDAQRSQIAGHYLLDSCKLTRASSATARDEDEEDVTRPATTINLKADCNGGWITLKNRNAQS
jgi:hypothetical protein